jgi:LPS export ABC transporter protein LptC
MSPPNLILAVALSGVLALSACEPEPTGTLADPTLDDVQWVQRGIGVRYQVTVGGVRTSTLDADTTYSFGSDGQDSIVMSGMRLDLFEDNGAAQAYITSRTGMMVPLSQLMYARGNAVLDIPAEQRRIESDTMYFDPRGEGLVRSDVFTIMIDAEKTVCGTGFVSDLGFRNIEISGMMSGDQFCRR